MGKVASILFLVSLALGAPSPVAAAIKAKSSKIRKNVKSVREHKRSSNLKVTKRPTSGLRIARLQARSSRPGFALQSGSLPKRIQARALNAIAEIQGQRTVKQSTKSFGSMISFQGSASKFVKGRGRIHSPIETKVLVSGKQEVTITRSWGREVGPGRSGLVVGTNRGYGPKQRQHFYSVSPLRKGVLLEMSTAERNGSITNRRAYEVNAKTGKRITELQKYRIN